MTVAACEALSTLPGVMREVLEIFILFAPMQRFPHIPDDTVRIKEPRRRRSRQVCCAMKVGICIVADLAEIQKEAGYQDWCQAGFPVREIRDM